MPLTATPRNRLVDIVSGSFGAGHDAVAREIAGRFEAQGYTTRTSDIVDLMPGHLGRTLRAGYLRQVQSVPTSWSWTLRRLENSPALARAAARAVAADAALLELATDGADVFVSTHPFARQALGRLRAGGHLASPVVTYLTDMSVHPLWVHPAVDLHLALNELPAREARQRGARDVRVIRPVVPARFSMSGEDSSLQRRARGTLGLPLDRPLALVTGGAYGVGSLERTASDIASTGLATPVVLCGRRERLLNRIGTHGPGIALGWIDDMPSLLQAVDVVVQNAGGFTSLETLASGVPILTYRTISGHGETNARALDKAGLVPWVRESRDLGPALRGALSAPRSHRPPSSWSGRVEVVDAISSYLPVVV